MTYAATGIVLRREDVFEWDRRYTLYTREHGKLVLIGKGTRRPRAKLAAHCEPFAEVAFEIARGRQVDRVTFARAMRTNEVFSVYHARMVLASFLCEAVDALTKPGHADPPAYDLLRDALGAAATALPDVHHLIPAFTVRLCSILGYAPALASCLDCRTPLRGAPAGGRPHRGGAVCLACSSPSSRGGVRGGGIFPSSPSRREGELEGVGDAALASLTASDRALITSASQSLVLTPLSPSVHAFAHGLLAAHLPYPMRTPLTGAGAPAMMAVS